MINQMNILYTYFCVFFSSFSFRFLFFVIIAGYTRICVPYKQRQQQLTNQTNDVEWNENNNIVNRFVHFFRYDLVLVLLIFLFYFFFQIYRFCHRSLPYVVVHSIGTNRKSMFNKYAWIKLKINISRKRKTVNKKTKKNPTRWYTPLNGLVSTVMGETDNHHKHRTKYNRIVQTQSHILLSTSTNGVNWFSILVRFDFALIWFSLLYYLKYYWIDAVTQSFDRIVYRPARNFVNKN